MTRVIVVLGALALAACGSDRKASGSGSGTGTGTGTGTGKGTGTGTGTGTGMATATPDAKPPNIVFMLADDQRADSVRCMRKLATLLPGALTFERHHAATPLCCPARTTQLTGMFAHHHGVLSNGDEEDGDLERTPGALDFVENGLEDKVVVKTLRAGGYRTAFFGKYLNGYDRLLKSDPAYVPPHWDDWYGFPHAEFFDFQLVERPRGGTVERVCYRSPFAVGKTAVKKCSAAATRTVDDPALENFSTDVLAAKAAAFITEAAREDAPFFLYFGTKAPHGPFLSPRRYQPDDTRVEFTDEAMTRLDGCDLFEWENPPPSMNETDLTDKPRWVQDIKPKPKKFLDELRKQQLVSVLANEDAIETIKEALRAAGELDNTVIIYIGDNGFAWGEHGYVRKNCTYEECMKVPFVMWDPRRTPTSPTTTAFTQDVDIAPTLLELAGLTPPADAGYDGTSVLPLFDGKPWARTEVLAECWGRFADAKKKKKERGTPDVAAAVRDDAWKYTEHYDDDARTQLSKHGKGDEVELYDMVKDPYELDNLARIGPKKLRALGYDPTEIDATVATYRGKLRALANLDEKPGTRNENAGGAASTLVPLETAKVSQLLGDQDKHLGTPTAGQTLTRFGVGGSDLGYPFESDGRLVFLFGDTIGTDGQNGADALGHTTDTNPDDGVALDFFTRDDGKFLPFRPRNAAGKPQRLEGFEVPVGGIRLGDETFVLYKDNHAGGEDGSMDADDKAATATDVTSVARFDEQTGVATTLCELSRQPDGKFQKVSLRAPVDAAGLPAGGPWILMYGTGHHRASDIYLAIIPAAKLASCGGLRYYTGIDGAGAPTWSEHEADARAVFEDGAAGEVSVTWAAPVGRYLATYDGRNGAAKGRQVWLRHAVAPWGPWSEPTMLFDPKDGGYGVFIHDPALKEDDGQAGPMIGKKKDHPETVKGACYAPFVIERWTKLDGDVLSIYYTLSVWNPYVVVLMRTDLKVGR